MKYRIQRDEGRHIGHDVLIYSSRGMSFIPPGSKFLRVGETIFEADIKTCRMLTEKFGQDCYVANARGKRVL